MTGLKQVQLPTPMTILLSKKKYVNDALAESLSLL